MEQYADFRWKFLAKCSTTLDCRRRQTGGMLIVLPKTPTMIVSVWRSGRICTECRTLYLSHDLWTRERVNPVYTVLHTIDNRPVLIMAAF